MWRYTLILIFLTTFSVHGQTIEAEKFKFGDLGFRSSKEEIVKVFGEPKRISEPNYECGFLSSSEQGKTFYLLDYKNIQFVGNEKDGYVIDKFNLTYGMSFTYDGVKLDMDSDLDKLIEVFGIQLFGSFHDSSTDSKLIRFQDSDDGIIFYLKDGRLSKLSYWSPC